MVRSWLFRLWPWDACQGAMTPGVQPPLGRNGGMDRAGLNDPLVRTPDETKQTI